MEISAVGAMPNRVVIALRIASSCGTDSREGVPPPKKTVSSGVSSGVFGRAAGVAWISEMRVVTYCAIAPEVSPRLVSPTTEIAKSQ